jgi:hypothetical protein
MRFLRTLFRPLRVKIPFVFDVLVVSDAGQIRAIEESGKVDHLHAYETKNLPWWVRYYFRATKFHDDERDLWFCPFESASNPTYRPRRAYMEAKIAERYTTEDVHRIASLLVSNADDETLAYEMVQVVNRRFFGTEIPLAITKVAKCPLQHFYEAILPWRYLRAARARKQLVDYSASHLDPHVHALDVGHNIGEIVQTTVGALRRLRENLDLPVAKIFTVHALTLEVPRIAIARTTFGGMLWVPTSPGRTVVILKNGEAATETHDLLFTFGTGTPERACVFMGMFVDFMTDLQHELRRRLGTTEADGSGVT